MLCTLTPDMLSAVSFDPLTHSRHNAGDRSVKVGNEINDIFADIKSDCSKHIVI